MEHDPECRKKHKSWPCCPEEMCPCDNDAFAKLMEENVRLQEQLRLTQIDNNLLMTENAGYREALEFYADRGVWGNGCAAIDPCDTYIDELNVLRGGCHAREALKGE